MWLDKGTANANRVANTANSLAPINGWPLMCERNREFVRVPPRRSIGELIYPINYGCNTDKAKTPDALTAHGCLIALIETAVTNI